jgi:hypothetical protein
MRCRHLQTSQPMDVQSQATQQMKGLAPDQAALSPAHAVAQARRASQLLQQKGEMRLSCLPWHRYGSSSGKQWHMRLQGSLLCYTMRWRKCFRRGAKHGCASIPATGKVPCERQGAFSSIMKFVSAIANSEVYAKRGRQGDYVLPWAPTISHNHSSPAPWHFSLSDIAAFRS